MFNVQDSCQVTNESSKAGKANVRNGFIVLSVSCVCSCLRSVFVFVPVCAFVSVYVCQDPRLTGHPSCSCFEVSVGGHNNLSTESRLLHAESDMMVWGSFLCWIWSGRLLFWN